MNNSFFLNYLIATLALILPIVVYVAYPGTSGVPSILMSIIIFGNYILMKDLGFCSVIKLDFFFKLFFLIIILGILLTLTTSSFEGNDVPLLLVHVLSWLSMVVLLMVRDVTSVFAFTKCYLITYIPCAIYSYYYYTGFGLYDVPHILDKLCLFLMISMFFPKKYQLILLTALIMAPIYDISARACLITTLFGILFYVCSKLLPMFLIKYVIRLFRIFFLLAPIVFVLLATYTSYNILSEIEEIDLTELDVSKGRKSEGRTINIDTRTEVYKDVFFSIENTSDLLIGKGSVIHLDSMWTALRNNVEAGILNIFLRYGLIGCMVFFIIIWITSRKGVYESNNLLTMLSGLYVSFRFSLSFLDDPSIDPVLYIAMGICLNANIRSMTNNQIKAVLSNKSRYKDTRKHVNSYC